MPKKTMPISGIPENFKLTETTLLYINHSFPTVNIEKTLERFVDSARAHGRMYADWQAAFRTWVRKAVENKWDGVEYKRGRDQDPAWMPVLNEARNYGFRVPEWQETPGSYRTALNRWKDQPKEKAPVIEFGAVLKEMRK